MIIFFLSLAFSSALRGTNLESRSVGNRQLNPPSQTIPFTLKAEFFQSLPRVKTDLMLLVHNVAPV
ncbi:hypothetical protein BPUTEOMOX_1074 [methanotrophic endosymbiont of Bathymodiolus puteoserpentis (Logatchev)]|nr:hypothetical protein BPUTEOMOX_1074 [methanotrophic endosymbiont of Bathymodiolus puteoserpentis (Logatchev)]